jgi:chemotaxis protein methyltransferase CheR
MDQSTFQKFRELIYDSCGINLNESKEAMVSSRIAKRMRLLGITSHKEYLKYLLNDQNGDETIKFLDVISTNTTYFFREHTHFDFLQQNINDLINEGQKKIRIWCAAASTGEEPYTIAMIVHSAAANRLTDMKVLATDISTKVLHIANEGKYEIEKIEKVPVQLRQKYFIAQKESDKKFYYAKDTLKKIILFRRLNLSKPPFPMKGPLDLVFCRNVMIYFDKDVRQKLINEAYRLLKRGGYLITGLSESITGLQSNFKCIRPSVYKKME